MGDHYLPQILLKHFCDSDGLLWVARKGQDQPFQTTPRNVFAVNNLYTKHTPVANPDRTGWTFQRDRSSEHILAQIEGAAADPIRQVIRSARKRRLPQLGPDPQDALQRFFFATARRTPESQKRVRTPDAEARHELYVRLSRKAEGEGVTLPSEDDFYATPVFRELIDPPIPQYGRQHGGRHDTFNPMVRGSVFQDPGAGCSSDNSTQAQFHRWEPRHGNSPGDAPLQLASNSF